MLLSNYQMVKAEALMRDGIIVIRAGTQATIVWVQIQIATAAALASCELIGCTYWLCDFWQVYLFWPHFLSL